MKHKLFNRISTLTFVALFLSVAAQATAEDLQEIERRLAKSPADLSLIVAAGRACLVDAQSGDAKALNKAEEYLDKALSLSPDDPQILVLHGSMLALKGRDAKLPIMKMRHVQNGLKEMDRAVELAPMDFAIRYQRGAYCLNLPDIFERAETAVEDFESLLAMAAQSPDSLSTDTVAGIRLNLAQAKLKVGDLEEARELLESVMVLSPGTATADRAKTLLEKLDG